MKVTTTWQVPGGRWDAKSQAVRLPAANPATPVDFELRSCDVQEIGGAGVVTMSWNGAVKKGEHRIAFYLIGQTAPSRPARWPASGWPTTPRRWPCRSRPWRLSESTGR